MANVPSGYVWIRDLIPDVQWNQDDQSITLPNGTKLAKNQYTIVNDRAYVNPIALASLYRPQATPLTPESFNSYYQMAESLYKPGYESRMDSLNRMINQLTQNINARIQQIESAGSQSRMNLERRQRDDTRALRNQSIARGTYTSGVSDYSQRKLRESYAPEFQQLESAIHSNLASAQAQLGPSLAEIAAQAKQLESDYMTNVARGALELENLNYARSQDPFENFLKLISAYNVNQSTASAIDIEKRRQDISEAVARAELAGYVTNERDAELLGVNVGTETFEARDAATKRQHELDMFEQQLTFEGEQRGLDRLTQKEIAKENTRITEGSAAEARQFEQAMQIWQMTNSAPDVEALKRYGITPGQPWNPSIQQQLEDLRAKVEMMDLQKSLTEQEKLAEDTNKFQQTFGADPNTSEAMAIIFNQPTRSAALALLDEYEDDLKAEGVDISEIKAKLDIIYPVVDKYLVYDYDEFIDPQTWTNDPVKITRAQNKVREFFETALEYRDYKRIALFIERAKQPEYKGLTGREILATELMPDNPNLAFENVPPGLKKR